MSSRREEKERAKAERIAAEEAAAAQQARRRMLGVAAGAVLAVAAVVAIVIAVTSGDKKMSPGQSPTGTTEIPKVAVPPAKVTNLRAAAKAAGCKLTTFTPGPNDREHVTRNVTYKQNPPVFGPHAPTWASDGSYAGRPGPPTEQVVHALEHGRVVIQYKPGLGTRQIGQLETLLNEAPKPGLRPGYNALLMENGTGMPVEVAATAWGQQLTCPRFNDKVFDALRAFRVAYVDKGPELIPQPE